MVLDDVLAHSAAVAAAQDVALLVDVEPGLEVVGVPDELARVLDNLVGNAVRSSGPGGVVRVAGHWADGQVRVAVEDSCGGIPEDERAHVFDEGFQGAGAHRQPGREVGSAGASASRSSAPSWPRTVVTSASSPPMPGACSRSVCPRVDRSCRTEELASGRRQAGREIDVRRPPQDLLGACRRCRDVPDVAHPELPGHPGFWATEGLRQGCGEPAHGRHRARADVERDHLSSGCGPGRRGHDRARDVVARVHEVPTLGAVLEHPGGATGGELDRNRDATPA